MWERKMGSELSLATLRYEVNDRLANPLQKAKVWDSKPRAAKSSQKCIKSQERSQISYWKDLHRGLCVLEVTYHFEAAAVNITIKFTI